MGTSGRISLLLAALAGAILLYSAAIFAWPVRPTGIHFMDETLVLKPDRYQDVESALNKLSISTNCDVRVGMFKSLDGKDLVQSGADLVQAWKMGTNYGKGAYILLVIFVDDHKMRLEYGAKLNGTGMDSYSQEIVDDIISPRFKKKDFAGGIIDGAAAFEEAVAGSYRPKETSHMGSAGEISSGGLIMLLILVGLMRLFGGFFGSSFGSDGSSGFGGGGFGGSAYSGGGGGCSGSW
jgi:uncharacterized protein